MERQLDAFAAALLLEDAAGSGRRGRPRGRHRAGGRRGARRGSALATAACCRPISSSAPSACGQRRRSPARGGLAVNRGVVVDDGLQASAIPASTPSANAPSIAAPATASSSPATSRRPCWPRGLAGEDGAYHGSVAGHQPQGVRRRRVLGRRFRRRGGGRGPRLHRPARTPLSPPRAAGTAGSSARVLFGDTRGRALVPRPHPHRQGRRRHAPVLVFGRAFGDEAGRLRKPP